jgi:hypothetical protein
MQRFAGGFAYVLAGLIAGAASGYVAIERTGIKPFTNGGSWSSRAKGLTGKSALYVRAHYLLQGRLPPAPGQIDEATSDEDADGKALTSGCRYRLMSTGPLPAWWSIAVMNSAAEPSSPQAVASSDWVIRESDGSAIMNLAASVQSGNWLRTTGMQRYTLLYSAVATGGERLPGAPPFKIVRGDCP